MKLIGITGPTGAGKTTALQALIDLGALIIDADAVYHELLTRNAALRDELTTRFGNVFAPDGGLDRQKLGNVVFGDPAALRDLDAIAHRYVLEEIERRAAQAEAEGRPAVAVDAIALIESGLAGRCDLVVGVIAPAEVRVRRIMAREGISEAYARKRISAQKGEEFFRAHCDCILENNADDTPEAFALRAHAVFQRLIEQ
ncbi:MAG: dephospho-CoA kinase [Intestinimonas sp.]|jgi:dephospho-CoA kinase|nr:dephospho-CoA kinase [Intestinimonas sp.]